MKRLGTVLHMSRNGYIVVRLEENPDSLPPLNSIVYDENLNRVGMLLDIIGPVKTPYAVVKPANKEVKVGKGTPLYYKAPRHARRKPRNIGQKGRPHPRREGPLGRHRRPRGSTSKKGRVPFRKGSSGGTRK